LIFVANYSRAEVVELLKASKAPVFRFTNFTSIEDIKNNIRTVGFATGCDAGAETLLQKFNDELAAIKSKIPANQKPPRVMSFGGGYTAGSKTTFNDIVRSAGAVNVSAEKGIDGFGKISAETIADWQPDYIIAGANTGEIENKRQQLLNDPIIKATKAGKAGNIIIIDNRGYLTVTHNIVRGIEELANGLYGNSQRNN
ncbi:MAG: ABC transporter substrate-binding protein, partial [Pyrinomonadaceae bacterium]|nr:ABC transporter substrate-binding protein [Pyrinomonadaceae bacterium]